MTAEHGARDLMTEQLCEWARELDSCDGYVVIVGDPLDEDHRIFGPYAERDALEIADHLSAACDDEVHVVRFHHPKTRHAPSVPRPRRAG